jgi:hypothetical protein
MKHIRVLLQTILLLTLALSLKAAHLTNEIMLAARLNGSQQVPAVSTNAVGVGGFSLNASMDTMCITITCTGLSGPITAAHIHEGAVGATGGVVLDLQPNINGNQIMATITGTNLNAANLSKYLQGLYYINIHTAANPNGEIRGQILLETDNCFVANINGMQQVPLVSTGAMGLGVFKLSKSNQRLSYHVITNGLSGSINSIHLHTGAIGTNGPVAEDLTSSISTTNGNVISGEIINPSILTDLNAGNLYINVHTTANPGGEIRGQLLKDNYFAFDARLDGGQQVPAVTTNANGVAHLTLNNTRDTLWYNIVVNGLTDTITSAHLHNAALGANGPVALDVSANIMGNVIQGMVTGAQLTSSIISELLEANLYINIHTTANPGGEIRGQVLRYVREAYSTNINAGQQVPSNASVAVGSGIFTIDRDQKEVHYMIVVNGINFTDAHIHKNVKGQNGGLFYDLSTYFTNNGAFGYWTNTDATLPFSTVQSLAFRRDSVYVNFHTAAFVQGEIRGQIDRGFNCYTSIPLSINPAFTTSTKVYPNPATESIHIEVLGNNTLEIISLTGVIVKQQNLVAGINTIPLTSLSKGYYLLQLTNSNNIKTVQKINIL